MNTDIPTSRIVKPPTLDNLIAAACVVTNTKLVDIGDGRKRHINTVRCRWLLVWVMKQRTQFSFPELARKHGNKSHSTHVTQMRAVEHWLSTETDEAKIKEFHFDAAMIWAQALLFREEDDRNLLRFGNIHGENLATNQHEETIDEPREQRVREWSARRREEQAELATANPQPTGPGRMAEGLAQRPVQLPDQHDLRIGPDGQTYHKAAKRDRVQTAV